jgi:hypothetical protein
VVGVSKECVIIYVKGNCLIRIYARGNNGSAFASLNKYFCSVLAILDFERGQSNKHTYHYLNLILIHNQFVSLIMIEMSVSGIGFGIVRHFTLLVIISVARVLCDGLKTIVSREVFLMTA